MSYAISEASAVAFFRLRENARKEQEARESVYYRACEAIRLRQEREFNLAMDAKYGVHNLGRESAGEGLGSSIRITCSCGWRGEWRGAYSDRQFRDLDNDRFHHQTATARREFFRPNMAEIEVAGIEALREYDMTMDGRGLA